MSLTGHIRWREGPVRAWLNERLPGTEPVVREANWALRGPPRRAGRIMTLGRPTTPPLASTAADRALAATALDLLVRATLAPRALRDCVAFRGADALANMLQDLAPIHAAVVAEGAIESMRPWGPLTRDQWRELAALCLLLARLEQAGRSTEVLLVIAQRLKGVEATVEAFRDVLVDDRDLDDVARVAGAVADDHRDLRAARRLVFGPTFALSGALGGADGDLVADGLLLDFKATSGTRIVSREVLWQLVGYALADTADEHAITAVGVSALRWRRRWTIALGELLNRLAGRPVDLADLRDEFATLVRSLETACPQEPPPGPPVSRQSAAGAGS